MSEDNTIINHLPHTYKSTLSSKHEGDNIGSHPPVVHTKVLWAVNIEENSGVHGSEFVSILITQTKPVDQVGLDRFELDQLRGTNPNCLGQFMSIRDMNYLNL